MPEGFPLLGAPAQLLARRVLHPVDGAEVGVAADRGEVLGEGRFGGGAVAGAGAVGGV